MKNMWQILTLLLAVALVLSLALHTVAEDNALQVKTDCCKNDAKQVLDVIMNRTSVRSYTDQPIPKAMIEQMLQAGMAAPSGVNKQPWEFIVVTDRATLDKLSAKKKMLKEAQAAIVVAGHSDPDNGGSIYWYQDCAAASQNILLAAHAFGLGAVWTTVHPHKELEIEVREILDMPEYITALNIIAIGYPKTTQQPKQKWNEAKIHDNKW